MYQRLIGPGIAGRIARALAASTLLYAGALVFAVSATRRSVTAGHSVPWVAVLTPVVLAAAVSFLLLGAALRNVSERLQRVGVVLEAASLGDLTATVGDATPDEIGAVGRGVDAAVTRSRDLVVAMHRATATLRTSWQEVEEVGLAMSTAAETTCVEALSAAAAADQVSSSIHVVAAATEELGATVREVAVHASEASAVAAAASEQAALATSTIGELESASQRVGDITKLITSIAGQTHLLALNATIEAARAGEMGRGFAVVASEVKELARETAEATQIVSRSVTEIRSGSGRATGAISEITNTIALVSENQSAIASAAVEQTAATNEISRVSAEAARGSTEIAVTIGRVSTSARSTAYAGGQARTTAAELARLETALTNLTSTFEIGEVAEVEVAANNDNALGTTTVEGVLIIQDAVKGTELHQFDYQGEGWRHSTDNITTGGTNSYNCTPDAVAVLRFVGTGIRFYGIADQSHGVAYASVDGGSEERLDMYAAQRASVLMYETPVLSHSEHRLELRVANEKNSESRYFWVAVDRVEIG